MRQEVMGKETAQGGGGGKAVSIGDSGSGEWRQESRKGMTAQKCCRRQRLIILLGPSRALQERRRVRLPMCKQQM